MPLLNLVQLNLGDRVQHELRVVDRVEKKRATGEPFLILVLGNASGQIDTAPIWSDKLADGWCDRVVKGSVVQVIGNIADYQGKRQLQLTQAPALIPTDQLRLEEYLPAIPYPAARLWESLDAQRAKISSPTLKKVLSLFFDDEPFRLRFEKAPASLNGHHGKLGGLLLHVVEVTLIAAQSARTMRANADLCAAGAMLHDIGKVEAYGISWEGFTRTPAGHLIEHVVLGSMMLDRALASCEHPLCDEAQRLELQHLILSHHGQLEYGSPVRPLTAEAEILHHADQMSSKACDMIDALNDEDAFRSGGEFAEKRGLWRVDRRAVWRRPHGWGESAED